MIRSMALGDWEGSSVKRATSSSFVCSLPSWSGPIHREWIRSFTKMKDRTPLALLGVPPSKWIQVPWSRANSLLTSSSAGSAASSKTPSRSERIISFSRCLRAVPAVPANGLTSPRPPWLPLVADAPGSPAALPAPASAGSAARTPAGCRRRPCGSRSSAWPRRFISWMNSGTASGSDLPQSPAELAMMRSVPTISMMSAARAGVHFVVG